ncbi:MAG: hypothetical protein ACP5UZ_08070 [Thermoplasmata archaeon]
MAKTITLGVRKLSSGKVTLPKLWLINSRVEEDGLVLMSIDGSHRLVIQPIESDPLSNRVDANEV